MLKFSVQSTEVVVVGHGTMRVPGKVGGSSYAQVDFMGRCF